MGIRKKKIIIIRNPCDEFIQLSTNWNRRISPSEQMRQEKRVKTYLVLNAVMPTNETAEESVQKTFSTQNTFGDRALAT